MSRTGLLIFFILYSIRGAAQIGAEAQGGKLTLWAAVGIDQQISRKWSSMTDFGFGRHSGQNDISLVRFQGLKVFTQDFIYQLNEHWRFSLSGGYWNRNYYSDKLPANRIELRPFTRIYYIHHFGGWEISHQLRHDFRWFYRPDFEKWEPSFEYRARYMIQGRKKIGHSDNFIIFNDELLGITDMKENGSLGSFEVSENRLSGYFRHHFDSYRIDLDLGLMHQYWRQESTGLFTTSYNVMIDLIIKDPFGEK